MTEQCEVRDKQRRSSKGASFIKVLGRDFYKQLQLPEDFTMNTNGYIPRRLIIESGITRKCWRVEVKKDGDGRMYFHDGWEEFVEAHSLEVGYFLVFEYEEQSIFQVRIYGRNGCERTPLLDSTKEGEHKAQNIIDDEDVEDTEALEFEPVVIKCHAREPKTRRLSPRENGKGIHKTTRKAEVSTIGNNMCFSITIHHSKKYQFLQLTIPMEISRKMNLANKDKVKLQEGQGDSWNVKLAHGRNGRVLFGQGWREFLKDNKVSSRDKLHFEFMSEEVIQVVVTKFSQIEHESDEAIGSVNSDCEGDKPSKDGEDIEDLEFEPRAHEPKTRKLAPRENGKGIHKTRTAEVSSIGNNMCFSITIHHSKKYQFLQLTIPMKITQKMNLGNKDKVKLQDSQGNSWNVKLAHRRNGRALFGQGWREFIKDNKVSFQDKLHFEFMSEEVIRVVVTKFSMVGHESDEAIGSVNSDCKHDKPSITCALKHRATEIPTTARRKFLFCESGNSFSCMWRESSARSFMYLPLAIIQAQNLMEKNDIVLRDPEGKCWPIEVKNFSANRVAFTKGWLEFWSGYGLANGDFLNFKFVSENLIQVTIKKNTITGVEDAKICLDAMDTTEGNAVIEPEEDMFQTEFDVPPR